MTVETPSVIEEQGTNHVLLAELNHNEGPLSTFALCTELVIQELVSASQEGQVPIQMCVRCRSQHLMRAGNPCDDAFGMLGVNLASKND
jgi:hypothetical protein